MPSLESLANRCTFSPQWHYFVLAIGQINQALIVNKSKRYFYTYSFYGNFSNSKQWVSSYFLHEWLGVSFVEQGLQCFKVCETIFSIDLCHWWMCLVSKVDRSRVLLKVWLNDAFLFQVCSFLHFSNRKSWAEGKCQKIREWMWAALIRHPINQTTRGQQEL